MKRFAYIFLSLFTLFTFSTLSHLRAEVSTSTVYVEEAILSFVTDITVNKDNSINVVDVIDYTTGNQNRHGLVRDIYPYSSEGVKMRITGVTVTDENKIAQPFEVLHVDEKLRIKIGDPDVTFSGRKIYWISYHVSHAIAKLDDKDEIYWNVTGNWSIPIYQAFARVKLPNNTEPSITACYFGVLGSTKACTQDIGNVTTFIAPPLKPHEQITVKVGFDKNITEPYGVFTSLYYLLITYIGIVVILLIPIGVFIFSMVRWYKNGKDPKGTGVIVPQYDVIDNLTPVEVSAILYEEVKPEAISAELIYLAVNGYVKIRQVTKTTLLFFKNNDYEITLIKKIPEDINSFDRILVVDLFPFSPKPNENGFFDAKVLVSETRKNFISREVFIDSVINSVSEKGYYKNLGRMRKTTYGIIAVIQILIGAFVIVQSFIPDSYQGYFVLVLLAIIVSAVIYAGVDYFSPAKTEKGVFTKEYLLGLKRYLESSEKRRLEFHNAPERKPEVFEKLLPYAITLGVSKIWAKEFEGIYTQKPDWYVSDTGGTFSAVSFNNSVSNFSFFTASSLSSGTESFSDMGGGDGAGGGGGGGGGDSW